MLFPLKKQFPWLRNYLQKPQSALSLEDLDGIKAGYFVAGRILVHGSHILPPSRLHWSPSGGVESQNPFPDQND
jgi:hypothetical protein